MSDSVSAAIEIGAWDCGNRDEVMALLRLRESQRSPDQDRQVRVTRPDEATFLVFGRAAPKGRRPWSRSRTAA